MVGCVSRYTTLRNPETNERRYCRSEGWGWLGAPMAISNHNKCIEGFKKEGFKEE